MPNTTRVPAIIGVVMAIDMLKFDADTRRAKAKIHELSKFVSGQSAESSKAAAQAAADSARAEMIAADRRIEIARQAFERQARLQATATAAGVRTTAAAQAAADKAAVLQLQTRWKLTIEAEERAHKQQAAATAASEKAKAQIIAAAAKEAARLAATQRTSTPDTRAATAAAILLAKNKAAAVVEAEKQASAALFTLRKQNMEKIAAQEASSLAASLERDRQETAKKSDYKKRMTEEQVRIQKEGAAKQAAVDKQAIADAARNQSRADQIQVAAAQELERRKTEIAQKAAALRAHLLRVGIVAAGALGVIAYRELNQALRELGNGIKILVQDAMPLAGISKAFESFGGNIEKMRKTTLGMMTDIDLMKSYNLGVQLVGKSFAERLPESMELLTKAAQSTGQTMDYMMSSLARGVGRLSSRILDNMGVQVMLSDAYADWRKEMNVTTRAMTQSEKMTAVYNLTLKKLHENLDAMPGFAGTAQRNIIALGISFKNLKNDIGVALLPGISTFSLGLSKAMETIGPAMLDVIRDITGKFQTKAIPVLIKFVDTIDRLRTNGVPALEAVAEAFMDILPDSVANNMERIIGYIQKVYEWMDNLGPKAQTTLVAIGAAWLVLDKIVALSTLGAVLAGIAIAVGAVVNAIDKMDKAATKEQITLASVAQTLKNSGADYEEYRQGLLAAAYGLTEQERATYFLNQSQQKQIGDAIYWNSLLDREIAMEAEEYEKLSVNIVRTSAEMQANIAASQGIANATLGVINGMREGNFTMGESVGIYDDMTAAMDRHSIRAKEVVKAVEEVAAAITISLETERQFTFDTKMALLNAEAEYNKSIVALAEEGAAARAAIDSEYARTRNDSFAEFNSQYLGMIARGEKAEAAELKAKYENTAATESVAHQRSILEQRIADTEKEIELRRSYAAEQVLLRDNIIRSFMQKVAADAETNDEDRWETAKKLDLLAARGSAQLQIEAGLYKELWNVQQAGEGELNNGMVYVYGNRLNDEIIYSKKVLSVAERLQQDLFFIRTASTGDAAREAAANGKIALDNLLAGLKAELAATGGAAGNMWEDIGGGGAAAPGAGGGTAAEAAAESATKTMASVVDDVKNAVASAVEAIKGLVNFEVPVGVETGLQRLGDFIVLSVETLYASFESIKSKIADMKDTVEPVTALMGVIKSGIDSMTALAKYESAENLPGLARTLADDMTKTAVAFRDVFVDWNKTIDVESSTAANGWWEKIQALVGYVSNGVSAMAALATYVPVENLPQKVRVLADDMAKTAVAFRDVFVDWDKTINGGSAIAANDWWAKVSLLSSYVKGGVDAMTALAAYEPVKNIVSQVEKLSEDMAKVAVAFRDVFTEWDKTINGDSATAANEWWAKASLLSTYIKGGVDAMAALADYEPVKNLVPQVELLASDMAKVAVAFRDVFSNWNKTINLDSATGAAGWWEQASKLSSYVKGGVEAMTALAEYEPVGNIVPQVERLASDMAKVANALRNTFVNWQKTINLDSATGAAGWWEAVSRLTGFIKSGVESLAALADYKSVEGLREKMSKFAFDMAVAAQELYSAFKTWTVGAGELGDLTDPENPSMKWWNNVKALTDVIKSGVDSLAAIADYEQVGNLREKMSKFAFDMAAAAQELYGAFKTWTVDAGELSDLTDPENPAVKWWNNIKSLTDVIKSGVDSLAAISDYKSVGNLREKMSQFAFDLAAAAQELYGAFKTWTKDAGELGDLTDPENPAVKWWNNVKALTDVIKPGIDALAAIGAYEKVKNLRSKMTTFSSQMKVVLKELIKMITGEGMPTLDETITGATYWENVAKIVGGVTPVSEAINRLIGVSEVDPAVLEYRFGIFSKNTKYLVEAMAKLATDVEALGITKAADFKKYMDDILAAFTAGVGVLRDVRNMGMSNEPRDVIGVMEQFVLDLGVALQAAITEVRAKLWHIEQSFIELTAPAYNAAYAYGASLAAGVRDGFYDNVGTLQVAMAPISDSSASRGGNTYTQTVNLGGINVAGGINNGLDIARLGDIVVQRVKNELRR